MTRFPWGDRPTPAHHCTLCGRRIGKTRGHFVFPHRRAVICVRCVLDRRTHAILYPYCPHTWHDCSDHHPGSATGAAAWCMLAGSNKP